MNSIRIPSYVVAVIVTVAVMLIYILSTGNITETRVKVYSY